MDFPLPTDKHTLTRSLTHTYTLHTEGVNNSVSVDLPSPDTGTSD